MTTSVAAPATTPVSPPDADALYEVVNGRRVELPPMGAFETDVASELGAYLRQFARSRFGRAVNEMLFLLDTQADLQRRPDVALVSYQRWPRHRRVPSTNAWAVVPELAVEVISPSNTASEVLVKIGEYFRAGTQLVWVVYPREELVYVYTSPTAIRVLDRSGALDGGTVLPEFRLPLAELFEPVEETDRPGQGPAAP
jgi:Uma2 family endonuclease